MPPMKVLPPVEEMMVSDLMPGPAAPPPVKRVSSGSSGGRVSGPYSNSRAVSCEPCRKSKLKCEKIFPCLRCVKLGLPCENPRANAEDELLAQRLTVRHGWGSLLGDPAHLTPEQRTEITRFRPREIAKDKAKLVLASLTQVEFFYGFPRMRPMLSAWADGLGVDLSLYQHPEIPRGELHAPSYVTAPFEDAPAPQILHPFLREPFTSEAFVSFGAVYRQGRARVLANQGWARAFYDEQHIQAMIARDHLMPEEVAASVVAPQDRDYLAACFDHCLFGAEGSTVEVVHVIECIRDEPADAAEAGPAPMNGAAPMASVGARRSSPSDAGDDIDSSGGSGSGSSGRRRQPIQALMQLRVVVEDDYLGFMFALQVLPLRVELVQGGALKMGSLHARYAFLKADQMRDYCAALDGPAGPAGVEGAAASKAGEGFATAAAAALGAKRKKSRATKRAGGVLVGAAGRRVKGAASAASVAAAQAAASSLVHGGGCGAGANVDARMLMPTVHGGAPCLKQEVTDECGMVMSELMAATAGDLFGGGHAEDVLSLLEDDDFGTEYGDEGRDSAATDWDTVASNRDSFYGRESDVGRESFRESFRESSVSTASAATTHTAVTALAPGSAQHQHQQFYMQPMQMQQQQQGYGGYGGYGGGELYAWEASHVSAAAAAQQQQQQQQAQPMDVAASASGPQQMMMADPFVGNNGGGNGFQHRPPPHPASQHFVFPPLHVQGQHQQHQPVQQLAMSQPMQWQAPQQQQPPQPPQQSGGTSPQRHHYYVPAPPASLLAHQQQMAAAATALGCGTGDVCGVPNRDSVSTLLTDRESAFSSAEEEMLHHGMQVTQTSAELAAAFEKSFEQPLSPPMQAAPAPLPAVAQQKKKGRGPMWTAIFPGGWRS